MATSTPPNDVRLRVRQLAADLAVAKPMRHGARSERTIQCSKPGGACAQDPKARPGPYRSLTRAVGGKTRSRFLTAEQAALARQPIDSGGEFRVWGSLPVWADKPARLLQGGSKSGLPTELQGEISQETERLLGHQAVADLDSEAVERATTAGLAPGGTSAGTAAERRPQRSCGATVD